MSHSEVSNAELLREIKASRGELKGAIDASETRLLLKLEEATRKIRDLEKENENLRKSVDYFNRAARANNLIIRGLSIADGESVPVAVVEKLGQLLGLGLTLADLNNAYMIGTAPQRMVKVEFISYLKRLEILKSGYKLKGTDIFINPDLTREERAENKILRDRLKVERAKGTKCYLRGRKLIIEEAVFPAHQTRETEGQVDNSGRRPDSEPSSLLSTPEVNHSRIFKTHQFIISDKKALDSASVSLDVGEKDSVAAGREADTAGKQPSQKLTQSGAIGRTTAQNRDLKNWSQRTRKGSGTGSQGEK